VWRLLSDDVSVHKLPEYRRPTLAVAVGDFSKRRLDMNWQNREKTVLYCIFQSLVAKTKGLDDSLNCKPSLNFFPVK
jgi:hypothetical protein